MWNTTNVTCGTSNYFALFRAQRKSVDVIQGRRASRLPLAIILRAFGAVAVMCEEECEVFSFARQLSDCAFGAAARDLLGDGELKRRCFRAKLELIFCRVARMKTHATRSVRIWDQIQ